VANCAPRPVEPIDLQWTLQCFAERVIGRTQNDITDDAALSGRLRLLQPRHGHRFGHDAILLAAAAPARDGDVAAELGAGVGAAGLALASRVPGTRVRLLELDPGLTALAAENARRNGLADRVEAVALDIGAVAAAFARAGLPAASFDIVLMNPPFNDPGRHQASPQPRRRLAHALPGAALPQWIAAAARLLRPGGVLTTMFRADAFDRLTAALAPGFGAITLMPIRPKPGTDAIRVIIGAVKASRAPSAIVPDLVLAEADGRPTAAAEAVLRDGAPLPLATLAT
jgi:tRNA1(Val) A37 N6-methylase TrmN6